MEKPRALKKGDAVGLAAPGGAFDRRDFERGAAALEAAGYRVVYREDIFERSLYLAGDDERRAGELRELFADPEARAVFTVRGGYGALRLLPYLDRDFFRKNPKILVGFSDATILHAFFQNRCGLVSFYGPHLVSHISAGPGDPSFDRLFSLLSGDERPDDLCGGGLETLSEGRAEKKAVRGRLAGGCLSLLVLTPGTPLFRSNRGKILFIEDVGEAPYKVDRMLTYLRQAGYFEGVGGVVFGEMVRCENPGGGPPGVREAILNAVGDLPAPILHGCLTGHGETNLTLPLGALAELDVEKRTLALKEPVVS